MKLLACTECRDIVKIYDEWRWCHCGKAASRYLEDGQSAQIFGTSQIIALDTKDFMQALLEPKGTIKFWWLLPEDNNKVQRTRSRP